MMLITRATDYAVRVLVALLTTPGGRLRATDLAAATALSEEIVRKVTTPLVRRGWVRSRRGARGGFSLTTSGDHIALIEVVELLEGPLRLQTCTGPDGCQFVARCPVHRVWREAETELRNVLAKYSMADLAARAHRQGLFVAAAPPPA